MSSEQNWACRLSGVEKRYRLYARPVDRVLELITGRVRHRSFTALKPLSLTLRKGAALGVVGDNGAGKSTLMHLMAGSHSPTSGTIELNGRVLGLLELGVGFHPEFTGRENIYFFGDTLGLPRAELAKRVDEVIDFSELGSFIEQPLRTYSTGMRVRLAFSLVVVLDPDILIVDEALSVGDLHFQKKCIDRMMEFRRGGKTIVFCSHSLYQLATFCDDVLWLQDGQMRMLDVPERVLPAYEAYQMAKSRAESGTGQQRALNSPARIIGFEAVTPIPMHCGDDLVFRWRVLADRDCHYHVSLSLKMDNGRGVFVTGTNLRGDLPLKGERTGEVSFPRVPLMGGEFIAHFRVWDDTGLVLWDEAAIEDIVVLKEGRELGVVRLPYNWTTS